MGWPACSLRFFRFRRTSSGDTCRAHARNRCTSRCFRTRRALASLRHPDLASRWEQLIKVRDRVLAEIEPLRKDKQIGSSLQAKVVLTGNGEEMALLTAYADDLPMLFIVSDVELRPGAGEGLQVTIEKAAGVKCERCWRYVPAVSDCPASASAARARWPRPWAPDDRIPRPGIRTLDRGGHHRARSGVEGARQGQASAA